MCNYLHPVPRPRAMKYFSAGVLPCNYMHMDNASEGWRQTLEDMQVR